MSARRSGADIVKQIGHVRWSQVRPSGQSQCTVGGIERGFDFLGYHFTRSGLSLARTTIASFLERGSSAFRAKVPRGFTRNGT